MRFRALLSATLKATLQNIWRLLSEMTGNLCLCPDWHYVTWEKYCYHLDHIVISIIMHWSQSSEPLYHYTVSGIVCGCVGSKSIQFNITMNDMVLLFLLVKTQLVIKIIAFISFFCSVKSFERTFHVHGEICGVFLQDLFSCRLKE